MCDVKCVSQNTEYKKEKKNRHHLGKINWNLQKNF